MKKLQALNKRTAPKSVMPEKIISLVKETFFVRLWIGLSTT